MWFADVQNARFFYARAWMDYLHIFGVREQRANASCALPAVRVGGWPSVGWLVLRERFFFLHVR